MTVNKQIEFFQNRLINIIININPDLPLGDGLKAEVEHCKVQLEELKALKALKAKK
jgi:hypothetical protein